MNNEIAVTAPILHRSTPNRVKTTCDTEYKRDVPTTNYLSAGLPAATRHGLLMCNECWYVPMYSLPKELQNSARKLLTPRKTNVR